MRLNTFIGSVFLSVLIPGWFTPAAGDPPKSDEYIVWVDTLNMRTEPALAGEVITTLNESDELKDLGEPPEDVDDIWWRHVRFGKEEGWVADWYTLPRSYYDAFREADELGKAGKAIEMVDKVIEAGKALGFETWEGFNEVSPDGNRIITKSYWFSEESNYWGGKYPGRGRVSSPFPVLLFVNGQGLMDYSRSYEDISGKWSPDSRYYAYAARPVYEYNIEAWLRVFDTAEGTQYYIGHMFTTPDSIRFEYEFEFFDGYILYIDEESVEESESPLIYGDSTTSVLFAYELKTGNKLKLLEADLDTLGGEDTRLFCSYKCPCYPVKMKTVDACPVGVEQSNLYKKYLENYGFAVNRTGRFE